MSEREKIECAACGHEVDAQAKICLYCTANPQTGERDASRPDVDEVLSRKDSSTPTEKIASTIRSQSGLVFTLSLVFGIALLVVVSSWLNQRQRETATDVQPVPLTEVTDLATSSDDEETETEIPELEFEFDGDPDAMETYILEEGEVEPEEETEETMNDER